MPELPEIGALAERLDQALCGDVFAHFDQLGFTGLKTFAPRPQDLEGARIDRVWRRGKYLVFETDRNARVLVHLSQAGRLDLETVAKQTKPRGSVVRMRLGSGIALLIREYGTERKARWWILSGEDLGPLATLGPEPDSPEFVGFVRESQLTRQLNGLLRDQHVVAGLGRGHTDDVLHRARLSPFAAIGSLGTEERERLLNAIKEILGDALARERERKGGLSEAKLGEHFIVHNRAGEACPRCGNTLQRVSYDSYQLVYCPTCQTKGKTLADRRLSRLLR